MIAHLAFTRCVHSPKTAPPHVHHFPTELVNEWIAVASALLAVAVGVFAFVPLIIDLALSRSADADRAVQRAKKADVFFDVLLGAIALLGLSLGCGIVATYLQWLWTYYVQVVTITTGTVGLLAGVLGLGWSLRSVRRAA